MNPCRALGCVFFLITFSCTTPPTEQTRAAKSPQSQQGMAVSSDANPSKPTQSVDKLNAPLGGCQARFTYEVRERAVAGHAHVFIGLANWDSSSQACWEELAEYYYNIAPDSGVTLQQAYFIAEPTTSVANKITTWAQMTPSVEQRVIGIATYDQQADTLYFEEHPFRKGRRR